MRFQKSYGVSSVNTLGSGDAIWHHKSGSTLAQIMACCLTAPSHYLNQCWLILSEVLWHLLERNFTGGALAIILFYVFELNLQQLLPYLPGANELIWKRDCQYKYPSNHPLSSLSQVITLILPWYYWPCISGYFCSTIFKLISLA